jgi:hypothetical protein
MNEMTASPTANPPQRSKLLLAGVILAGMILLGFLAFRAFSPRQAAPAPAAAAAITQSALEQQYGLHVNLVAVTAAGGLVDVRFKLVDGEKVKTLLQEPGNFPTLRVAGSPVTLSAPEEGRPEEITYEDGANLFLMYPNAGNLVKPGTLVTIVFGDLQVEPIVAK